MDYDALADLALSARGILPGHPDYARYKAALVQQARNESSVQGVWFEEDIRRFDANLQSQKAQIDNQYKVAMAGVKNEQERIALDRWKAEQDVRLTEARIAIEQGNLEVARERLGIERGAQGLDLLRTTVDLNSQVRNWAAALDWRRGVSLNPNAPVFLRNMLENAGVSAGSHAPTMVAPQGLPEQNSLAAVLSSLGVNSTGNAAADQTNALMSGASTTQTSGQAATSGAQKEVDPRVAALNAVVKNYVPSDGDMYDQKDIAALKTIAAIAAQGSGKSANKIAQLTEDERDFFAGGLDRLGIGGDGWLAESERRRYGGGTASGVAA